MGDNWYHLTAILTLLVAGVATGHKAFILFGMCFIVYHIGIALVKLYIRGVDK